MTSLAELTPGIWTIDSAHTTIGFTARHLMITKVRGRFGDVTGDLTIAEEPMSSSVQATIAMDSIDTGSEGRDSHLRSPEFFDIENHPTMSFASTEIRGSVSGAEFILVGDLTVRGVTKSFELNVEFEGVNPDPWGGTRVGFTAEGEIDRRTFGLDFQVALDNGSLLVSEKIKNHLDVQAVRA